MRHCFFPNLLQYSIILIDLVSNFFLYNLWGPCEAKLCWSATRMMAHSSERHFYKRQDEIVPNRCKLQSLLAVSVTVPVNIYSENLFKWRNDLQSKTTKVIKKVKKLTFRICTHVNCHNSRQPSLLHCCLDGRLNMAYLTHGLQSLIGYFFSDQMIAMKNSPSLLVGS